MATIFDAHRAAAVQGLNARVAHADGVRVVAMLLVGLAGVPRPEQLDAVDRSVLRISPATALCTIVQDPCPPICSA